MPKNCLRCTVELSVHVVTCPGVWLPRRDDIYLRVTLFNQVRHSQIIGPIFPLLFHEKFQFDKTFYTAFEPSQVADRLQDECVDIELIQLSNAFEGGKLLASYYANARDFLYPYPMYSTNYGARDRELLLDRSVDFPGIQPKLEFAVRTVIKDAASLDNDDYAPVLNTRPRTPTTRKARSRPSSPTGRKNGYTVPTVSSVIRSTSPAPQSRQGLMPSLRRRLEALDLYEATGDDEDRPPFVVRKQKSGAAAIISRQPGGNKKSPQYPPLVKSRGRSRSVSKSKGRARSRSFSAGDLTASYDNYASTRANYTLNGTGLSDSDDAEIAELTASGYGRVSRLGARSPSPLSYRTSLRHRFDTRPYSPATSDIISRRITDVLRDSSYVSPYVTPVRRSYRSATTDTIDDLARDLALARSRRYY